MEDLPSVLPLFDKDYSLEPDMIFGWKPELGPQTAPIPLKFKSNLPVAYDVQSKKPYKTIFYGFRPYDSYILNKLFSDGTPNTYKYDFNHSLISAVEFLSKKNAENPQIKPRPFEGMAPDTPSDALHFDSKFESGNLDKVVMISKDEYDLYMRADTNTHGYYRWFYFKVDNIQHERTVRFNILNYRNTISLFEQGMRPVQYSTRRIELKLAEGWERTGNKIKYLPSNLNKYYKNKRKRLYYMLSFEVTFSYPDDVVYFAETVPYTMSRLDSFLRDIKQQDIDSGEPCIDSCILSKSLGGINVPMLTITDQTLPDTNKKLVVITARVHPSETMSSWIMEGLLRYLTRKDPKVDELRKKIVFKVVPMLNPDGVIAGNARTCFSGDDLNRVYIKPDYRLHPCVYKLKELVENSHRTHRGGVFAFIDIHAHSKKKGCFMYGPSYPLHDDRYLKCRIIPKLMSDMSAMFRYYSCKFRYHQSKLKAARVVFAKRLGIPCCFTLENSAFAFIDEQRQTVPFGKSHLFTVGENLIISIFEYLNIIEEEIHTRIARAGLRAKKKQKRQTTSVIYEEGSKGSSPRIKLNKKPGLSLTEIFDIYDEMDDGKPVFDENLPEDSLIEQVSIISVDSMKGTEEIEERKLEPVPNTRYARIISEIKCAEDQRDSSEEDSSGSDSEYEKEDPEIKQEILNTIDELAKISTGVTRIPSKKNLKSKKKSKIKINLSIKNAIPAYSRPTISDSEPKLPAIIPEINTKIEKEPLPKPRINPSTVSYALYPIESSPSYSMSHESSLLPNFINKFSLQLPSSLRHSSKLLFKKPAKRHKSFNLVKKSLSFIGNKKSTNILNSTNEEIKELCKSLQKGINSSSEQSGLVRKVDISYCPGLKDHYPKTEVYDSRPDKTKILRIFDRDFPMPNSNKKVSKYHRFGPFPNMPIINPNLKSL